MLLFLFNGTEFRVVFCSAEGFGTEFREFLFRGTTGIPSEITICSVNSVFRGIILLSEIPNPSCKGRPTSFLYTLPVQLHDPVSVNIGENHGQSSKRGSPDPWEHRTSLTHHSYLVKRGQSASVWYSFSWLSSDSHFSKRFFQ
jgi:hypothetical protein